jgi:hypothetical protein
MVVDITITNLNLKISNTCGGCHSYHKNERRAEDKQFCLSNSTNVLCSFVALPFTRVQVFYETSNSTSFGLCGRCLWMWVRSCPCFYCFTHANLQLRQNAYINSLCRPCLTNPDAVPKQPISADLLNLINYYLPGGVSLSLRRIKC